MTEEQLNELSIYSLRDLARRTGVPSPTSKRKEQLIRSIIDINEGRQKPKISTTKQGRPPKNNTYNFAQAMGFTINGSILSQKKEFVRNIPEILSGYIEFNPATGYFLMVRSGMDFDRYYLSPSLITKYNLKVGDFVHTKTHVDSNSIEITDVMNVNNTPIKIYSTDRLDYYDIPHTPLKKKIAFTIENFKKFNINVGESVYIYGTNNSENSRAVVHLLNDASDVKKIYVNTCITEKNKSMLDTLENTENFVVRFTDDMDKARQVVKLATERAKRLLERGEDVILAIDDILSIASIDSQDLPITKTLVSLTKSTEDKGSISVFAIMSSDKGIALFEKLADKRIKVEDQKLFLID